MTLFRTGDPRPIHFMGIAGAGMSALAMIARHRGVAITGCDSDTSGAGVADLTALGVQVWQGHDPSHVDAARAVVVTAAVPREHPELERARALGLSVVRRADALGELVNPGGGGKSSLGADDAGADRVALKIKAPVWRVGHGATADVRIRAVRLEPSGSRATISLPDGHSVELVLAVPGLHNVRNAAAALAVVHSLGADVEVGAKALAEFHSVGRRFERLGEAGGITVVDDYAHHPTEVAATLAAARQAFPGRRVIAVFQPHLFSRTALHGEALGKALAAADMVVVAPIYAAREQPQDGVTHHLVVRGATRAGAATVAVRDRAGVTTHVARAVREGDVVFTLGAGDITRVGPELLKLLGGGGGAGGVGTQQGAVA